MCDEPASAVWGMSKRFLCLALGYLFSQALGFWGGQTAAPGELQVKNSFGEESVRLQVWSQVSRKALWKRRVQILKLQFVILIALDLSVSGGVCLTPGKQKTTTDTAEMLEQELVHSYQGDFILH